MNSKQFLESTTSGSVATVSTPLGKTQTRSKGVYPNEKSGNLLTGKKTNKKFANSNPMKEAKLDEEDVIIVPGQGKRLKPGLIAKDKDRTDHEVEMALSDLFQSAKNAKHLYELIKDVPETVGIEGWVQEKIIKASDYLNTAREYLEHKQLSEDTIEGKRDNFSIDDIKQLERIKDLETIKARARELVKGKPDRRMKPEKIDYFYNKIDSLTSPMKVIKLMYDLLLAGEGMKTIGTRYSTSANSYQRRFNEMTDSEVNEMFADREESKGQPKGVAEGYRIVPNIDRERYQERKGLEGPFRARNGKVYYYDPAAGMAYDPDTDIYIDYDTLTIMDRDEDLTMENNMKPAKKQPVDRIIKDTIMADQISKDREGNYIFRKGYYYRPSKMSPDDWAEKISKRLQEAGINNSIVDLGDIWKPFKGGASLKAQSHYYVKIKVDNTNEGLEDDFSAFLQDLEKKTGVKGSIRKPGEKRSVKSVTPIPQTSLSQDEISELKNRLKTLYATLDKNYQYSDDYSVYSKNAAIAQEIRRITATLRKHDDTFNEGVVAKAGGALALVAALMGGNELTSAKHTPLGKALATAAEQGDQQAAEHLKKLDVYLDTKQTALVTKLSNRYLHGMQETSHTNTKNPPLKKESSIMRGIQNETTDFRKKTFQQQLDFVNKIKSSDISDWEKEYLIKANHPNGKVFKASYYSFPKGERARKELAQEISTKHGIPIEDVERLEISSRIEQMNELASDLKESCPECGGKLVAESDLNEEGNKDACYHKVKSRYKVWPSAYASGALVQCRKKGASNWGNKKK